MPLLQFHRWTKRRLRRLQRCLVAADKAFHSMSREETQALVESSLMTTFRKGDDELQRQAEEFRGSCPEVPEWRTTAAELHSFWDSYAYLRILHAINNMQHCPRGL